MLEGYEHMPESVKNEGQNYAFLIGIHSGKWKYKFRNEWNKMESSLLKDSA